MEQLVRRKAPGLFVQPNKLTIPEGALLEAREVSCLREGIYSKRRGFNFFGDVLTLTADVLLEYQKHLVIHALDTVLFDRLGDGVLTAWPGVHYAPAGYRMQGEEAAKNFYFTTEAGVMKADGYDGTPRRAGMPRGLDVGAALAGTGGGVIPADSKVGYRVVFIRKDLNGNEVQGEASFPDEIANPAPVDVVLAFDLPTLTVTVTQVAHGYSSGDQVEISDVSDAAYEDGPHTVTVLNADTYTYTVVGSPLAAGTAKASKAFNASVDLTLPGEVLEGDFWELYRTEASATEDTPPGDRYLKVVRKTVSSADVSAGSIAYTDTLDEALLGKDLETNPQRNGQSQSPARPPWARFLIEWKEHVWYLHTRHPHILELQLLDVAGLTDNLSSITITASSSIRSYTFAAAEDLAARKFKRWTTSSTLAENLRKTAKSLCKVINRDASSEVTAEYTSGVRDAPGKILLTHKLLNQPAFSVIANNSTTGGKWTPALPTSGATVASDDDYRRNGIFNSRAGRPEAVPLSNEWRAGSDLRSILGAVALNDAILVFTEGGAWYISGDSDGGAGKTFRIERLDPTLILLAPGSLVTLDNHAFGVFTQGVCRVSSAAGAIVSRQIETDLLRRMQFPGFASITFACAYESDHTYLVFLQGGSGDSQAEEVYAYSVLENAWAGPWKRKAKAAIVLEQGDNRLYLARHDTPRIVQERKSYSRSGKDFMDETYPATVTTHDTTVDALTGATVSRVTVTWTGADQLGVGWRWQQGFYFGEVTVLEALGGTSFRLTLDRLTTVSNAACELSKPIDLRLKYVLDGGNAAALKQATELQIYFEDPPPRRSLVGFLSDVADEASWLADPILLPHRRGWGMGPWGHFPWGNPSGGSGDPLRTRIPRDHQRHRVEHVYYRNRSAGSAVHLLQMALNARVVGSVTQKD